MSIEVFFEGKKGVNARVRNHIVKTDQPVSAGGDDQAVTPFELFLASLATCAGIYVRGFCDNRNIPTAGIKIVQHHEFDEKGKATRIHLEIHLPADFPDKYVESLVSVAGLCKVKQHLLSPPAIEVTSVKEK